MQTTNRAKATKGRSEALRGSRTKKLGLADIAIRVNPTIKQTVQEAAAADGMSVNAWMLAAVMSRLADEAIKKQVEEIEKQLDDKFAELVAAVQRTFKPDALDRKYSNPEAMRQRVIEEAKELLEDWRGHDLETKPRGTIERLCDEYCKLEQAHHDATHSPQEPKGSGVDWEDEDGDEDEGTGIEDVVYDNEYPPNHDD